MAPAKLETEDHTRDAAFNKAMHKDSSNAQGGFSAMLKKDKAAQKAAVDEYFKHWDNKAAKDETPEIREVHLAIFWIALRTNFTRRGKLNTLPSRDSK
jgi:sterol 24-C-methyltransferase